MLSSVNVIYFRTDHKLIPVFYRKQKKRNMYWEESGKIPKLKKKISTRVTTSTTHDDTKISVPVPGYIIPHTYTVALEGLLKL